MFVKIRAIGAMLALLTTLAAGSAARAADTAVTPTCCAAHTRCCAEVKYCCDEPEKAKCCLSGTSCCGAKDCCGSHGKSPLQAATCPVTGLARRLCCASKAAPMPPCCQKGCDTPGRMFR